MKRFIGLVSAFFAVSILVGGLFFADKQGRPNEPMVKAIWVTRFNYSTPDDVGCIIQNLGKAGFTDVFFQVRGNGTALYRSDLEPWAFELSGNSVSNLGKDPGWDPLQLAIDAARSFDLRVHAYMNVLPGWKGLENPPEEAQQLWLSHPDWFMVDLTGQKMRPTSGWYAFLNPVMPEVRKHLRGIVSELCRYDVAGVHLDYIRYPHDYHLVAKQHYPDALEEELMRHSEFSYDPVSLAALHDKYGQDVSKDQIRDFRCESITRVVRDFSLVMQVERPKGCLLSASVMGNPVEGKYYAFQDSGRWVRQGLVDWVVQMDYATRSFDRYLGAMKKTVGRKGFRNSVVVGLYCKNDTDVLLEQMATVERSGSRGIAFFAYTFLFDKNHEQTQKGRQLLAKLRRL